VKRLIPLVFLLTGGCAAMHRHPVATPTPAAVAAAPCVDPSQVPKEPPTVGQKFNGDAKHDLQILAPNALALRQWGEKLRGLLEPCLHAAPAEAPPAAGDAPKP